MKDTHMKPLNLILNLKEQISAESRQASLDTILYSQIQTLEKLIESNGPFVKDPGAYNAVAGLLDQLKYLVPAIFKTVEKNKELLDNILPDGYEKPRFGGNQ
jgi:hypothetical protein